MATNWSNSKLEIGNKSFKICKSSLIYFGKISITLQISAYFMPNVLYNFWLLL
jgi:hypothetical protein